MFISLIGFKMFHFLSFGPKGMLFSTHNVLNPILTTNFVHFIFFKTKLKPTNNKPHRPIIYGQLKTGVRL